MTNAMSNDVSTILCGLEVMILGSALWLLTVLFQIWMPRPFTLALATIGTALWLVGVVNICTMLVPILCTPSRDLTDNNDHSTYTTRSPPYARESSKITTFILKYHFYQ
jgi:predicted phage tail protein